MNFSFLLHVSERESQIEDLSGEIWFEIFLYFDGQSLINSFSKLNSSVESLLNDYRLPIHLNIFCSDFFVPNPLNLNQIISLRIDYSHINNTQTINLSSFVRLRSLYLIHINGEQLEQISQFSLKNLYQVSIESKYAKYLTKIVSIYFPYVIRMRLNSMEKEFIVKSLSCDARKNQIEKLTLIGKIKLAKLARFWSFVRI